MIIFRYLCKEIYGTLLAATFVMLIVLVSNQLIYYLNEAAGGVINFSAVLKVMSLQLPLLLGYLIPLSLFLGILIGLGRLASSREIVVLSACGISRIKLLNMVMIIISITVLITAWLMFWEEPLIQRYRANILNEAMKNLTITKAIPGRFQYFDRNNYIFYTKTIDRSKKELEDVFLAHRSVEPNGKVNWDIVKSKTAVEAYLPKQSGKFLLFHDGYRTIGTPGENNYQFISFEQYGIRLGVTDIRYTNKVKYWPTSKLIAQLGSNSSAAAEFHWRAAMPISALILGIIAISLSHINPRAKRFTKLFPAILIYIVYENILFVGRDWIKQGKISPYFGLWYLHGIMFVLALILLGSYLGWWRLLRRKWRKH